MKGLIFEVLKDGKPRTSKEITETSRIKYDRKSIGSQLSKMVRTGEISEFTKEREDGWVIHYYFIQQEGE